MLRAVKADLRCLCLRITLQHKGGLVHGCMVPLFALRSRPLFFIALWDTGEVPRLLCVITRGDALGTAQCVRSRSAAAGRMLHGMGGFPKPPSF